MVGSRKMPEDHSYLRKMRKPMIEKKRRDRMNTSIEQLKLLMADSIQQTYGTKLDKADVLDMTVSHIRQLKNLQDSVTMATDVTAYSNGFKDCARETIRYLAATGVIDPEPLSHLSTHLFHVHEKKTGSLPTNRVTRTTRQQDLRNTASPPVTGIQPPHHSTPVSVHSASSTPGSRDSRSSVSDLHSSASFSDMDVSLGCHVTDLSVPSDSFVRDVMSDSLIKEEKPWRPW